MFFQTALMGGLLIAGQASAKVNSLFQRSEDLESVLRRDADSLVATLTERDVPDLVIRAPQVSTTPASGDAENIDFAQWENQTRAACDDAMSGLKASNPSGFAVCYNLPFLDSTKGIFMAELRLYSIAPAIDPWTGISSADVMMSMAYSGARIGATNNTLLRRDLMGQLVERQDTGSSSKPEQVKVQAYVGQINDNLMGQAMQRDELKQYLIPTIELTAQQPDSDQMLSVVLDSEEASFKNGVFAQQDTTPTDAAAAAASASDAVAAAEPFDVPGMTLAFFPTGLVITCVWTGLFIAAVGAGTVGRIQFREQYRRRVKREMASGFRTI
ncbi:hypothetical protein CC78DRAFT_168133 [Lojkania enalia]|uniref:Uncharacterized protein n=1 Tax=Lojkania enalia TaxID=147567 RepID=A0A9P4KC88_9PLEO|nr:hypothetical protein CC78DRAFT_168133 [Didymosphaeria enalia]